MVTVLSMARAMDLRTDHVLVRDATPILAPILPFRILLPGPMLIKCSIRGFVVVSNAYGRPSCNPDQK